MQGDGRCLKLFVAFAVILLQYLNPSLALGIFNNSGETVHGHRDADADMTGMRCIEREREALLAFKQGFVVNQHSQEVFSSWGRQAHKQDCCNWIGVYCDNKTGHVIQLDLGYQNLQEYYDRWWGVSYNFGFSQGKMISPKLIELRHLEYLDLSDIDFNGSQIPDFIGSLTNLKHLDLFGALFGGQFPSQVGNLTHLQYLDLGSNDFINVQNLNWLPQLSSLKYLTLSYTNLSNVLDWSEVVSNLTNLRNLTLWGCGLLSPPIRSTTLSNINSSKSLSHVDLNYNHLTSSIFPWLSNSSGNLVYLDLSFNQLTSKILNLELTCSLQVLRLSNNSLSGQLSNFVQPLLSSCAQNLLEALYLDDNDLVGSLPNITNFLSLKGLDLSNNQLSGGVHESIGQLPKLEYIKLGGNALEGVISESHFSRLSRLSYLDLSFNSLVFNFTSDWIPPFQLDYIYLASCKKLGPHFPKWLETQNQYSDLDISDAGISDVVPSWLWNRSPNLSSMNLSHNQIRGTIFANLTLEFANEPRLDLSSNQLEGLVPSILLQASYLDLSNNKISGSISSLCASGGMSSPLTFLSLSGNKVSGELPDCLRHLDSLIMLDLSNNALSGQIPMTIGSLFQIETLKLRGNNFVGELPSSLKNCTRLRVIDVGDNQLSGSVPKWLGVSLQNLVILMLSFNHLNGTMPSELCRLSHIQILDFSMNNISGSIPKCLNSLTALSHRGNSNLTVRHHYEYVQNDTRMYDGYDDDATFLWKGSMQVYKNTLGLVKRIDLSSNRLTGEIPSEITHLVGLVSLNLSRNHLTGHINPEIGNLDSLDSLDLSRNWIDGRIPAGLAWIDRLGMLDWSYNNLSGKIPTGTQLQGFDPSVYVGNPQLCGLPLPKTCMPEPAISIDDQEDTDELITQGFYISMALGFVVGFWGVCGSLIFNRTWRYTFYKFLNGLTDWLYVKVALIKRRSKDVLNR